MRRCGQADRRPTIRTWSPQRLGLDLVDVTYSGATTAHVLTDRQHGAAAAGRRARRLGGACHRHDRRQRRRLRAAADGGGPAAGRCVRCRCSVVGCGSCSTRRPATARWSRSPSRCRQSAGRCGERAPRARVLFVDYLTLLPPAGQPAPPLSGVDAALGRRVADTLERLTAEAAAATGCELVRAAEASRCASRVVGGPVDDEADRFGLPLPGRPVAAAPERGGHARRGRPDRRAGGLTRWAR